MNMPNCVTSLAIDITDDSSLSSLTCQINQSLKSVSESSDPKVIDCPYLNLHATMFPRDTNLGNRSGKTLVATTYKESYRNRPNSEFLAEC